MSEELHPQHKRLVETLKADKSIQSEAVERAFLAVPRHKFLPHLSPEEAYENENIPTKHSIEGEVISSASHPGVVAEILEELKLSSGQKVLEIGAGTGFNAALIAHLVGDKGRVISLDFDGDIVEQAKANLDNAGVTNVDVYRADGHFGFEALAPYDCIVMSTSSNDIYPSWFGQLKEGGLLGLAVRFRAETATFVVFVKKSDHFASYSGAQANFMPMRGATADFISGEGEALLRERIESGKAFNRILVYPSGTHLPQNDRQIALRRKYATFLFQWD